VQPVNGHAAMLLKADGYAEPEKQQELRAASEEKQFNCSSHETI